MQSMSAKNQNKLVEPVKELDLALTQVLVSLTTKDGAESHQCKNYSDEHSVSVWCRPSWESQIRKTRTGSGTECVLNEALFYSRLML